MIYFFKFSSHQLTALLATYRSQASLSHHVTWDKREQWFSKRKWSGDRSKVIDPLIKSITLEKDSKHSFFFFFFFLRKASPQVILKH